MVFIKCSNNMLQEVKKIICENADLIVKISFIAFLLGVLGGAYIASLE